MPANEKVLFSWIHLSDIHFRHGNEQHQIDQELVLKALLDDVSITIESPSRNIPHPDSIFVTGDIAYSGSMVHSDEYEVADKWLSDVAQITKLSKTQIYVIPGNHDIQRNVYSQDDDMSMFIDMLRDGKRLMEWALSKHHERLMSRLSNFNKFAKKYAPFALSGQFQENQAYWQWTSRPNSELPVRIIGLNTALLCQNDDDKGKLRLSLSQIKDIPNLDDSHVVIGLGHHPFDWLANGDEIEKWLRKKIHIYLSGHVHSSNSIAYQLGGGVELICVQAGAVHNEDYSDANHDSFNYSAIVQKNDGSIALRVWNRVWSENNKDFRDDVDFHPVDQPYAEFGLGIKNKAPVDNLSYVSGAQKSLPTFNRKSSFVSDSPPVVEVWVGRKDELNLAKGFSSGVLAITGIGGQGKSALASKFVDEWISQHPNAFWDWRDCREQRERFHTHLVGIIEHWTDGSISGELLDGADTKELVRLFFEVAENQTGLVILDNVDHYVDVENGEFSLGVAEFVKVALQQKHNLTVVLTCRPRVNYASTRFQELHLKGISEEETIQLFELRDVVTNNDIESVSKIHHLTDGHPFWLNLIATQVARQPERFEQIIGELVDGEIDNRAKIIMNSTWRQLDAKQKTILRYMAELTGPETVDWIYDCVKTSKEFKTQSRFNNTFYSLQALNLIVESRGKHSDQKEYDLHPIVRSYIVSEYRGKRERRPYQDGILWVINTYISKLGAKISIITPISQINTYIKKAEISIRKDDVETSIKSLLEVSETLIRRGVPGELFRIGEDILSLVEKDHEKYIDLDAFHELNKILGNTYAEYDRKEDAVKHVERYSKLVRRGTAQYVAVCDVACYVYWMIGEYKKAISWGREGVRLKVDEHIDTNYDSSHPLALALRDSGNIKSALDYFLSGKSVNEALDSSEDNAEASMAARLGNIGRCLHFDEEYDMALRFYIKSARLLEKGESSVDTLNQGFAALWIGDVLRAQGDFRGAYIAYRKSEIVWAKRSPLRVDEPRAKVADVSDKITDNSIFSLTESGVERLYSELLVG